MSRRNRRFRTSVATLNGYGHYVYFGCYRINGNYQWHALCITNGPHAGIWKF